MSDPLVPVAVACPCPGTPHGDGDTVFLAPELTLKGGLLAEAMMVRSWGKQDQSGKVLKQTEASLAVEAALREVYVLDGVRDWTFVDEAGELIELNEETVRGELLSRYRIARPVGDKADELYSATVLDPLLSRIRKLSPGSLRRVSTLTSQASPSGKKRPRPRKPSSTASTATEPLSA